MTLEELPTLLYTFAFVVPGFVFYEVVSLLVPTKPEQQVERLFLKCLIVSFVNYAVWFPFIYLFETSQVFVGHLARSALGWSAVVFVGPALLGLLVAKLFQKRLVQRGLRRLGFFPIDPVPTAWDWKFSTIGETWVLVTMEGYRVRGRLGRHSFMSSASGDRDIYIEDVYRVGDGGPWQRVAGNQGIWINAAEIKSIEFFQVTEGSNGEEKRQSTTARPD